MFAVAFDLDTIITKRAHPKSVRQAYLDIGMELKKHGFTWVQGSLYVADDEYGEAVSCHPSTQNFAVVPCLHPRYSRLQD